MEILRLLDRLKCVKDYEIQDYKRWTEGFYYRLKILFTDDSVLFAREYVDPDEKN